jgi:hypothetical protein
VRSFSPLFRLCEKSTAGFMRALSEAFDSEPAWHI